MTTDHVRLASVLVDHKRHIAELHDGHLQLRLLVEAGDTRHLGWAVDELVDAAEQMASLDGRLREVAGEDSLDVWIRTAPDGLKRTLERLGQEIHDALGRLDTERSTARRLVHARLVEQRGRHR